MCVFGIDNDATTLRYELRVDEIGTLAAPGDGNAADRLTEGEPGKSVGAQGEFPNGAIRGQLAPQR